MTALELAPTSLIVGCGFLGRRLATALIERGRNVVAVVRGEASAAALERLGAKAVRADVADRSSLDPVVAAIGAANAIDLFYLVPPGRRGENASASSGDVLLAGPANVRDALKASPVRRAIVASSTAVYGHTSGERVDADTPPEPLDERGRMLLESEHAWRDGPWPVHIVRLAGLYGPGRIVGMQALRSGAPLVGDPQAWLNLIHVDDAVDLLLAMMTVTSPAAVELGSDGSPVMRIDYYTTLAQCMRVSPPRVLDPAAASSHLDVPAGALPKATSKRCDNVLTCQRTGWLPRYPHFLPGLRASFEEMQRH